MGENGGHHAWDRPAVTCVENSAKITGVSEMLFRGRGQGRMAAAFQAVGADEASRQGGLGGANWHAPVHMNVYMDLVPQHLCVGNQKV